MMLLGLPLSEAERILREAGKAYSVTRYQSSRPYEGAEERVVRATMVDGACELVACGFKTTVDSASQDQA